MRRCSTRLTGKGITLDCVEPGIWFGNIALSGGDVRAHEAPGPWRGTPPTRSMPRRLPTEHIGLYEAFLQLLTQEGPAQLLAASPQRVKLELKKPERQDMIRINADGLVVRAPCRLHQVAAGE